MNLLTTGLPELLAEEARRAWQNILESAGEALADRLTEVLAEGPEALQLPRVLACSPFVADSVATQAPIATGSGRQWPVAAIPA